MVDDDAMRDSLFENAEPVHQSVSHIRFGHFTMRYLVCATPISTCLSSFLGSSSSTLLHSPSSTFKTFSFWAIQAIWFFSKVCLTAQEKESST